MKILSIKVCTLAIGASLTIAACSNANGLAVGDAMPAAETAAPSKSATAKLRDTDGKVVGTVTVTGVDGALMVEVSATDLPPGIHGAHIHTTGDCSAPDFTSAGGHWNPTNVNHGTESDPPHPHAGDTGNIEVGVDGTGKLTSVSTGAWAGLLDEDGSAFVIHADADDMKSQPSGKAGARIACGVFTSN